MRDSGDYDVTSIAKVPDVSRAAVLPRPFRDEAARRSLTAVRADPTRGRWTL